MTFDEDDFGPQSHLGSALDGGQDISGFIPRGDNDGTGVLSGRRRLGFRSGNENDGQTEVSQGRGEKAVEQCIEDGRSEGPEDAGITFDNFSTGQVKQIGHIIRR